MSFYLHDVPLAEAQARFEAALRQAGLWQILGVEHISLDEAAGGRVLAEPVWARLSSPHYHASAMDGYAVRASTTAGAMPGAPLLLPYDSQALYVDTGDPLPEWADAVIPIENVEPLDNQMRLAPETRRPAFIRIRAGVTPWSSVRALGEDMVATQLVLPAGQILRPVDLGAAAASGASHLSVARRPRVAILPTGTELALVGTPVKPGEVIEFNSIVLAAQARQWGALPQRYPPTPDDFEQICAALRQSAADSDLVLINAGSSAGSEDFTARAVEALGELLVHGVAVRPGHPVILGMLADGDDGRKVPVIGVPGYPVSAALTGEIFVEPLLRRWLGLEAARPVIVQASLTRKITSPAGDDDFVRVALGRVGGRLLAAPMSRGAGAIGALTRADGLALLPRGVQGLEAGESVSVRLYRSMDEIEQTILALGSHDLTLDLLAQHLAQRRRRLVSGNVGSQAGLVALRRKEAHLAGSHLLDPPSGTYNIPFIHQYLPGQPVAVVALVNRQQGLIVRPGNPAKVTSLLDLTRPEVTYVNRQRGAGTRVLLDSQLDFLGIAPAAVAGYNQEVYTHLAVAASVASGRATCGLGIAAAARALDLDFIPLFEERYDFIIPGEYYESELLQPLFDLLHSSEFRTAVAAMPGYDITPMGTLIARLP